MPKLRHISSHHVGSARHMWRYKRHINVTYFINRRIFQHGCKKDRKTIIRLRRAIRRRRKSQFSAVGWVERNSEGRCVSQIPLKSSRMSSVTQNAVKPNFTPSGSEKRLRRWVSLGFLFHVRSMEKVCAYVAFQSFGGIRSTQPTILWSYFCLNWHLS